MTNEKIKRQFQQALDENFRKAMTGNVQTIAKDAPPLTVEILQELAEKYRAKPSRIICIACDFLPDDMMGIMYLRKEDMP